MENVQPAVQSVFGPIFIGVYFNAILYGVLAVQTYFYYQNSPKDALWEKYLVFLLLLVETVESGLDFSLIWQPLIGNYGSPVILQNIPTAFSAGPFVTSFISTVVQMFQGWRIWKLTKSNSIFALVALTSFTSLAAGTTTTVLAALHPSFSQLQPFEFGFLAWLLASAASDVTITISLSWFVLRQKSSDLASTKSILNKIMLLIIQTGLITAVAAVADVLTFTIDENKTLQLIWAYSLSKLYSNSLLAMLNARIEWKKLLHSASDQNDLSSVDDENLRSRKSEMGYDIDDESDQSMPPATIVHPPF